MPEVPEWGVAAKAIVTVVGLTLLWSWETFFPFVVRHSGRWRHAGRNLTISLLNAVVLALFFGTATVGVALWAREEQFGLLNWLEVPWPWRLVPAILLLDCWLYVWHRMNHRIPLLWRFHRMHHSDAEMDVTTATRFHLGEHLGSATLRLGIIPLAGLLPIEILIYETLVVVNTMVHHANITLGWLDRPLRWLIVTPRMHQIHHSRYQPETDSNYSTIFSFWDRLFRSYRMRAGNEPVELGLKEFDEPHWHTVGGMLKTPFVETQRRGKLQQVSTSPAASPASVDLS